MARSHSVPALVLVQRNNGSINIKHATFMFTHDPRFVKLNTRLFKNDFTSPEVMIHKLEHIYKNSSDESEFTKLSFSVQQASSPPTTVWIKHKPYALKGKNMYSSQGITLPKTALLDCCIQDLRYVQKQTHREKQNSVYATQACCIIL